LGVNGRKMTKKPTSEIFEKIFSSKWFAFSLLVITPILNALIALIKKDIMWVIITIGVVIFIAIIAYIFSVIFSRITKDIISDLIKQDGKLDQYLKDSSTCMTNVQKECVRKIENTFFINKYNEIKFFNIDEILEFEKEVKKGIIWIITDELGTEVNNEKVRNAIASNLQDGTVYHYFYTQEDIGADAELRLKTTFNDDYKIKDIGNKMCFKKVGQRYDALLKLTKDIIILNPKTKNRRAFLCLFADVDFDIAFYREIDDFETQLICGMILNNELTNNK
jgi:flagellar basal body-associated protein FliL